MGKQLIQTHQFSNGLTLVMESMQNVQSAAFSLMVPGGSIYDQPNRHGTASILSDLITRGAGPYDSQQLSSALDNLGVQRHEGASSAHITFSGATLADNLAETFKIYSEILKAPHLPENQFDASRAGAEQALLSVEDDPRQKAMVELKRRSFPAPWGLPSDGELASLPHITIEDVKRHYETCFHPNEMIIGVAGKIDFDEIQQLVEETFGSWKSSDISEEPAMVFDDEKVFFTKQETTQTHLGIAYDAVPYGHPDYYTSWAAVGILSGGMSSRLFTEVREKRGLCYTVSASLTGMPGLGRVLCYAGTTSERAQETLDVTIQELLRLSEGIEESELERCKARAKSSLIMSQESTSSRASSIARDWFYLKRVTTLDQVNDEIQKLTIQRVLDYTHAYPARNFTILTIGPQPLEVPSDIS
ncbi:M16 family metallopeptidase [Gimesia aquarii]|uniref:Peptidase M16 inactive domain protein n=1 Tax=Gimesia aquarii TaxID=2527964 RepID=A0A517X1I3_9PLAN|nr:pitrilysin family protein [Gimesia aquarii]QDU11367.1 Peptidase M16 inactive domain protein [Gimesia aquarii]